MTSARLPGVSRFEELLEDFFYRPDEDVGALFDAAAGTSELPAPVEEEVPREFLAFHLGVEVYALPIEAVREIVKVPVLTELPRTPADLLGVMNLRGEVLPVYDLKLRLRLSATPAPVAGPGAEQARIPRSSRILVLRDGQGDAGVLVDAVQEVVRLRPSTLEAPPRGISSGDRQAITGLGRRHDQLFILLDPSQALA